MTDNGDSSNDTPPIPEWWDKEIDKETREKWKPAVTNYLVSSNSKIKHLTFSIDFVKLVVLQLVTVDVRWKNFPLYQYNISEYKAHKAAYNAIHEEFDRLMAISDEEMKQKKEKAKQKKALEEEKEIEAARELQESVANRREQRECNIPGSSLVDNLSNKTQRSNRRGKKAVETTVETPTKQ